MREIYHSKESEHDSFHGIEIISPQEKSKIQGVFGPWLWKEAKNEEEKVKSELHGRQIGYHWVEVSKRTEKME
jgi:hypothetical protein